MGGTACIRETSGACGQIGLSVFGRKSGSWNRMLEDLEVESCVICDDPLDGVHQTSCQMCGGKFHQPWSHDSEIPQCGRISSHEEALAIVYLCNDCFEGRRP